MRPLYDKLIAKLAKELSFKYKIGKAYIGLIHTLVFCALHIQTKKIIVEFVPRREFKNPRIIKSKKFQKARWAQYVELKGLSDIDGELIQMLK